MPTACHQEGRCDHMTALEVRTATEAGRTVVALAGECDLGSRQKLTSVLLAAFEGAPSVFVDLGALRFLDSSGLHALVTGHHAARQRDGHLYLVNAVGAVARLLDVTGVGELLRPPAGGDGRIGV
jgi:anti-sigma B factor antagonist